MALGLFLTRWMRWSVCIAGMACLSGCGPSAPQSSNTALASGAGAMNPAQVFKGAGAPELALARAAQSGDIAAINHLMRDEHVDPDRVFGDDAYVEGNVPLLAWPILAQQPDSLKAMLDNGANPNARRPGVDVKKYPSGKTETYCRYDSPMVWAAKAENPIYLNLLLAHGGNPSARTVNCETLLFQAYIWHGQWQNVQVLVEHGADVNAPDWRRGSIAGGYGSINTILDDYTSYGDFDKAWWLIAHGATPLLPKQKNADGTPRYKVLEDIFWYPSKPSYTHWQVGLQCWALQHGYHRPPMPDYYRKDRKEFGMPYEEQDMPLPDCKGVQVPASSNIAKEPGHAATTGD